jgi:hypothetical protein
MFLLILTFPLVLALCYGLPFIATIYAEKNSDKWLAFWLLTLLSTWIIIPFFSLFFECLGLSVIQIIISLALIFLLNEEKVQNILTQIKTIKGLADSLIKIVEKQVDALKKRGNEIIGSKL